MVSVTYLDTNEPMALSSIYLQQEVTSMTLGFLQKGAESNKLAAQAQHDYEQMKEMQGKAFRFSMQEGEKGVKITFVDGDLDPTTGVLLPDRAYEHSIQVNNKWTSVICPEKTIPAMKDKCPICEEGKHKASLVAYFTIIDHRTWTSKDGKKTYTNQRKLFPAKSMTFEELNAQAIKRSGLAGCTFEVRRVGSTSAGVGSHFDFEGKQSIEILQQQYLQKKEENGKTVISTAFAPLDYEKELIFRTGDELRKLGFGSSLGTTSALSPGGHTAPLGATDYANKF